MERLNRRRHLHLRQVAGGDPPIVLLHQMAVVDEHRDHLFDEQRVALGCRDHARRHFGSRLRRTDQVGDQLDRLGFGQRFQQDRGRVRDAAAPRRAVVTQLGARLREQEDRRVPGPLRNVLHEIEEGRLGPVEEVVQEEDQWSAGGEDLQEPPEGPRTILRRAPASPRGR